MKKILIFLCCIVFFCVALVGTCSAAEHNIPTPDIEEWDKTLYPYAVVTYTSSSGYWLTLSSESFTVNGADQVIFGGAYITYKLNETTGLWVKQGSYSGGSKIDDFSQVIYSTHDILNTQIGSVTISATPDFFQPPPPMAEVIQGVTEETLKMETLPALGGTMNILTLCGVGLMACLVVLSLFGKRSLISRH